MRSIYFFLFCTLSFCGDFKDFIESYKDLPHSVEINQDNFLFKAALGEGNMLISLNKFSNSPWLKKSIDLKNEDGKTPLEVAIENNNEAEFIELLKLGANIPEGKKALENFYSFIVAHLDRSGSFLETLINLNINFNFEFLDNDHFIHKLIKLNHFPSFFLLSNTDINLSVVDKRQENFFHLLARSYDREIYEKSKIFDQNLEYLLTNKNHKGLSPIHLAAKKQNTHFLKYFSNKNNLNDTTSDISNKTALHIIASSKGKNLSDLIIQLIEWGANPKAKDKFGSSPLFYAYQVQNQEAIEALWPFYSKKEKELLFQRKKIKAKKNALPLIFGFAYVLGAVVLLNNQAEQ